jgi:hypothetical protein
MICVAASLILGFVSITAALFGEIALKDARVQQSNFDNYQILRMNEAPAVEVHMVANSEPPGGMGEAGTSAIVPAVANAIFAGDRQAPAQDADRSGCVEAVVNQRPYGW